MKKLIFLLFLFLFSLSLVNATGVSPSKLVYEIEPGEEMCQKISITSDSEKITVTDKWAENKDVEWRGSLFDKSASYHSLEISYDKELLEDEREIEVCISGEKLGEYHGIIIIEEELVGNTIIQMGVWLKVNIMNKPVQPAAEAAEGRERGGGGITYSNKIIPINEDKEEPAKPEEKTQEIPKVKEEIIEGTEEKFPGITGASVAQEQSIQTPTIWALIILITMIVIAIGIFIIKRKRHI